MDFGVTFRPFGEDLNEELAADLNDLIFEKDFGAGDFQTLSVSF